MFISHSIMMRLNRPSSPSQPSRSGFGIEKTLFGNAAAIEMQLGVETPGQRMALQQYQNLFALSATLENVSGSELQDLLDEQLKKMDEARRKGNTEELDKAIALIREILRIMKKKGISPR